MRISFIIISYNTRERLESCLDILGSELSGSKEHEIIVVDNNSLDKTDEMLRTRGQFFIANKMNLGFAKACNQAAKLAKGDILLFLNSDVEFKRELLVQLEDVFINNSKLAIVSPRLISVNNEPEEFCCGNFPTLTRLFSRKISLNKNSDVSKIKLEVDWVSGAALAIRREIFNQLNGFDENFFMYFEDVDLCFRTKDLGYKVAVLSDISLTHYRGESLSDNRLRKKYYYKSQLHYFYKNFGLFKTIVLFVLRLPLIIRYL